MKLEIQAVGNPKFPRYIIVNDHGEVHDGTGWNKDRKRAERYAEGQHLATAFSALEEAVYNHLPLRQFTVNINVSVRAEEPFTKADVTAYLASATCIFLDHAKGTGPTENSLVQLNVAWNEMRENGVTDGKKTEQRP